MPPFSARTLLGSFSDLICDSFGDLDRTFAGLTSFENAKEDSVVFALDKKSLQKAMESKAGGVIAHVSVKDHATDNKTWLFSKNPELAACMVKRKINAPTPYRGEVEGVHQTATIDSSATLGENTVVGPRAFVGKNCRIGKNCFIGMNTVIEDNTVIGDNTTVHPMVYIGHSCVIGKDCEIMPQATVGSEGFGYAHDHLGNHYRIPHTGRVLIADDVHIGAGTCIDRGTLNDTTIGQGTKIDNQCHLAHNSVVGKNGLITAQFVNAGSATIGDNFVCGGKVAVAGHTITTNNVHVAAFSAVHKSVDKPGQYGGYPLQPIKEFFKTKATLNHITEMRKNINKLMKAVFPEES